MGQSTVFLFIVLLILLILLPPAFAGWNSDPAKNLAIADLVNDQVQAKPAATKGPRKNNFPFLGTDASCWTALLVGYIQ